MSGGTVNADVLHVSGDIDCNRILPRKPLQFGNPAVHVYGGTGVPPASLGVSGDYYLRRDGGGAGATHLYFNNAGTWIGIA